MQIASGNTLKILKVHEWVIHEANEDLDNFAKVLTDLGVKVRRPESIDALKSLSTDWKTTGWYILPRDLLLPIRQFQVID